MFILSTSIGYVHSVRHAEGVVTVTYKKSAAKKFSTQQAAMMFVARYADAGYGLNSNDVVIKEVV